MTPETTPTPQLEQPVFATENSIGSDIRASLVRALNRRLADSIDLQVQAKIAHWNVRGPQFLPLHELFDQVNDKAREFSDLIAERIGQLGGLVEVNVQTVSVRSELDVYPLSPMPASEHVERVATSLGSMSEAVRGVIREAEAFDDHVTADILTEIARSADKMLWFVESHLQK